MRTNDLTIDRDTIQPKRYQRVKRRQIGAWWFQSVKAWRVFFAAPFQGRISVFGKTWSVIMPARGILVIDPNTVDLTPWARNGDYSDFSGGGAFDIDPFGEEAPIERLYRVTQRCPWGRYNLDTGALVTSPVPNYNLSSFAPCPPYKDPAWPFIEYDGEHLVRWIKWFVLHREHPVAQVEARMALENARLFWHPYGRAVMKGPAHEGHGYVGRSAAWTAVLSTLVDGGEAHDFENFMSRVLFHAADEFTGCPQRLVNPDTHGGVGFRGQPQPWAPYTGPQGMGSGVPANLDVFQMLEACHLILAFEMLGMLALAEQLSDVVLAEPTAKWIDCDTGLGVGQHGPDFEQVWIALGALARINLRKALEYSSNWPIMHPYNGSIAGPYKQLKARRAALVAWNRPGKTRAFLEATA